MSKYIQSKSGKKDMSNMNRTIKEKQKALGIKVLEYNKDSKGILTILLNKWSEKEAHEIARMIYMVTMERSFNIKRVKMINVVIDYKKNIVISLKRVRENISVDWLVNKINTYTSTQVEKRTQLQEFANNCTQSDDRSLGTQNFPGDELDEILQEAESDGNEKKFYTVNKSHEDIVKSEIEQFTLSSKHYLNKIPAKYDTDSATTYEDLTSMLEIRRMHLQVLDSGLTDMFIIEELENFVHEEKPLSKQVVNFLMGLIYDDSLDCSVYQNPVIYDILSSIGFERHLSFLSNIGASALLYLESLEYSYKRAFLYNAHEYIVTLCRELVEICNHRGM